MSRLKCHVFTSSGRKASAKLASLCKRPTPARKTMYARENARLAGRCTARLRRRWPDSKSNRRASQTTGMESNANTYQSPSA